MKIVILTIVLLSVTSFASTDVEKNLCIKQLIIADDYGMGPRSGKAKINPVGFKKGKSQFYFDHDTNEALLNKRGTVIWSPAEFLKDEDGRFDVKSLPGGKISSDDLKQFKDWYVVNNKYVGSMTQKDFIKKLTSTEAAKYEKIFSACEHIDDMQVAPHKGSMATNIKKLWPKMHKKFALESKTTPSQNAKSSK